MSLRAIPQSAYKGGIESFLPGINEKSTIIHIPDLSK
jgi:hypothetical protein